MAARIQLTPKQQKQLGAWILSVAGLAGWFFLFLGPQRRAIQETAVQAAELDQRIQDVRGRLGRLPQMKEEVAGLNERYGLKTKALPPEEQLPELLETVAQMARQNQVQMLAAKPQSDVNKLERGASGYLELSIAVFLVGGYHELGHFIDSLEGSEELLRVRELFLLAHLPRDYARHPALVLLEAYLQPAVAAEAAP